MAKNDKKKNGKKGLIFKPFEAVKVPQPANLPAKIPARVDPNPLVSSGRRLIACYPDGTYQNMRGEYIGVNNCPISEHNISSYAPEVRLHEELILPANKVHVTHPEGQNARQNTVLKPGQTLSLIPTVVIVDMDAKPYESILYAPEPGCLKEDPLWPARITRLDKVPRPLPFATDWNEGVREFSLFGPSGTLGTFKGIFGFQSIATNDGKLNCRHGRIPGTPCLYLPEEAIIAGVLNPAKSCIDLPFTTVVIETATKKVLYYPPIPAFSTADNLKIADLKSWPERVVLNPDFPEDATFAGTDIQVRDSVAGPPLLGLYPGSGFAGFDTLTRINNAFARPKSFTIQSSIHGDITFPLAETIRESFVTLIKNHPDLFLDYTHIRSKATWEPASKVIMQASEGMDKTGVTSISEILSFFMGSIGEALNLADIVLWEQSLAQEASGDLLPNGSTTLIERWNGKLFPRRLLRSMEKPQFHLMKTGNIVVRADERGKAQWGIDRDCQLSGILLVPCTFGTEEDNDGKPYWQDGRKTRWNPEQRTGIYSCFFFMPLPDGPPLTAGEFDGLSCDEGFFRARWFPPLYAATPEQENDIPEHQADGIYHAWGQIVAMLDFMESPRIELAPEIWQEPDEAETARLKKNRDRKKRRRYLCRYLTLRRIELAPEVLESLPEPEAVEGKPLAESHFVRRHEKRIRYGPGNKFVRTVVIERHQVRKDLPLREGAAEAVEAREAEQTMPRYIKVVR